jgi:hypothetical protein
VIEKIKKFPDKKKNLSQKKIIETLRLKYPRVERRNSEVEKPSSEVKEAVDQLKVKNNFLEQGYIEYRRICFESILGLSLLQVIYRSLKEVYGTPDFLKFNILDKSTSLSDTTNMKVWPIDWGYLIDVGDGNLLEIIKEQQYHDPDLIIWLHLEKEPEKIPEKLIENLTTFLSLITKLVEIVDNDYSFPKELEKPERKFPKGTLQIVINKYYQNFQAGKDLLRLSEEWVSDIDELNRDLRKQGKYAESADLHRKGNILYVSSIIYFLMAIEGFINLLYMFLLKPKFKKKEYERVTEKNHDLEMRILNLPAYCNGFSNANFGPDDVSFKQWRELRDFRNNLLHANITEENKFTVLREDYFYFQYNPLCHHKKRNKDTRKLHTQQLYIRRNDVTKIQDSVQKFVYGIIEKMDENERIFINSWIDRLEIWFYENMDEISFEPFEHTKE